MSPGIFLSLTGLVLAVSDAPREPLARLGSLRFRHGAEVTALGYSADGKLLASGGVDHLVHVWNVQTGQRRATLSGHTGRVTAVAFFPDHQRLLTASVDGTVRLWRLEPVQEIRKLCSFAPKAERLNDSPAARTVLALSRDGKTAVFAGPDRVLRVWDVATDREVKRLTGHDDDIVGLTLSPDGTRAVSSGTDASVLVWDVVAGKKIHAEMLNTFSKAQLGTAFSPDGRTLAIAAQRSIVFLDLASKKTQQTWLPAFEMPPTCSGLMYSHHGLWLLTYAGARQGILAIGVESKTPLRSLKVDLRTEPCWALAPDNKVVALAPSGGDIVLWELGSGKLLQPDGHVRPIEHLVFSRDGKTLFSSASTEARCWDADTGKQLGRTVLNAEGLTLHAGIEGGAVLLAVQQQTWQRLAWDGASEPRPERKSADGPGIYHRHAVASPRGRWLAVTCVPYRPELVVWDVVTGRARTSWAVATDSAAPVFTPDERYLGQVEGQTLRLYDFRAGAAQKLSVADERDKVRCAAFSADGRLAALAVASSESERLFCIELATQQIRYRFPRFSASVEALALSPDGRHLAVAAEPAHTIHLLEVSTGAEVGRLTGQRSRSHRLVFSARGDRLASASADAIACVWNVAFLARGNRPVAALSDSELQSHWDALTEAGGARVHEAIERLSQQPGKVVPFLEARFRSLKEPAATTLARKVKELDDDRFLVRESASAFLAEWVEPARPLLTAVVDKASSPEAVARARQLLANHKARPELAWREFRAIEVLERLAVPAAQELLRAVATDSPTSPRAREAQAALERSTHGR